VTKQPCSNARSKITASNTEVQQILAHGAFQRLSSARIKPGKIDF
jgi:hypothetical protein